MIFSKISVVLLVLGFAFSGFALELKEARKKGMVKELSTGYLEVSDADPKGVVKKLVTDVNKKRKSHYEKVAKKNNTSVDAVAAQAAKKIQMKLKNK